jgi:hypothetical protein
MKEGHLRDIKEEFSEQQMGGVPTFIGEVGIPFNMHGKAAYRGDGDHVAGASAREKAEKAEKAEKPAAEPGGRIIHDYRKCAAALDATLTALEANKLSFTLWNYCPDHNPEWGDNWNLEDLSVFSNSCREPQSEGEDVDLDSGGRALEAFVRPYPMSVQVSPPHCCAISTAPNHHPPPLHALLRSAYSPQSHSAPLANLTLHLWPISLCTSG